MNVWGVEIVAEVSDIIDLLRIELDGTGLLKDLKRTHNNLLLNCIAHGDGIERNPSMGISEVDVERNNRVYPAGTVNCFTCGYKADLPTFISNCFGYNDKGMFGYKWLTKNFLNLSIESRKPLSINLSREKEDLTIDIEETIFEDQLASYRFTHPYMYERKLTDKVIEYFDIGFDREKNALTFPVFNLKGEPVLIQRRSVSSKVFINDEGGNKGNYIFGLYQVYKNISWIKELIVCESPIDALTCWTYRVPAVALMGSRITITQANLLRDLPIRKLISGLDNDKAGIEGTIKMKELLGSNKLIYRLLFPKDKKDINDFSEEEFTNRQISL